MVLRAVYIMKAWLKMFPEKNFSLWPRDCSCDIWQIMWLLFALVQKRLPDAKLKSVGLMVLAEEISNSLVVTVSTGY